MAIRDSRCGRSLPLLAPAKSPPRSPASRQEARETTDEWWQEEARRKRGRADRDAKLTEEQRIRALAEAEVARRLGDAA